MAKLNKIKVMLQNILSQFGQISTDKGILQYDGEELEVGAGVVLVDEEGNESIAEDGKYYLGDQDGRTVVVENSTIKEIIEPVEEVEEVVEAEDENAEEVAAEIVNEVEEVVEEVAEVAPDENAELKAKIEELEALIAELKSRIEALENAPASEPAEEEFKSKNSFKKTGIQKIDRLVEIMSK